MSTAKRNYEQLRDCDLLQYLKTKKQRWNGRYKCRVCSTVLEKDFSCSECKEKFCSKCLQKDDHEEKCDRCIRTFDCPSCGDMWTMVVSTSHLIPNLSCKLCSLPICNLCGEANICSHSVRKGHNIKSSEYEFFCLAERTKVFRMFHHSEDGDDWLKESTDTLTSKSHESARRLISYFDENLKSACVWPKEKNPISLWTFAVDLPTANTGISTLIGALLSCRQGSFSWKSLKKILGEDIITEDIEKENLEIVWKENLHKYIELLCGLVFMAIPEPKYEPAAILKFLDETNLKKLVEDLKSLQFPVKHEVVFKMIWEFCKNKIISQVSSMTESPFIGKKRRSPDSDTSLVHAKKIAI